MSNERSHEAEESLRSAEKKQTSSLGCFGVFFGDIIFFDTNMNVNRYQGGALNNIIYQMLQEIIVNQVLIFIKNIFNRVH